MKRNIFNFREILLSLLALLLIFGCLSAANWQFNKATQRNTINSLIKANLQEIAKPVTKLTQIDPTASQWRTMSLSGNFDLKHQSLVRDRYNNGVYGFEVLQLFRTTNTESIWIDRGWVKAGRDAKTPPVIPLVSDSPTTINIRIRSENLARQLQGSFYAALPAKKLSSLSALQGVGAVAYYGDLQPSGTITPLTEIVLPDLTGGPHAAYAIQWLAFALMILVGRVLLFRAT